MQNPNTLFTWLRTNLLNPHLGLEHKPLIGLIFKVPGIQGQLHFSKKAVAPKSVVMPDRKLEGPGLKLCMADDVLLSNKRPLQHVLMMKLHSPKTVHSRVYAAWFSRGCQQLINNAQTYFFLPLPGQPNQIRKSIIHNGSLENLFFLTLPHCIISLSNNYQHRWNFLIYAFQHFLHLFTETVNKLATLVCPRHEQESCSSENISPPKRQLSVYTEVDLRSRL